MPNKYLYIDDNDDNSVIELIIDGLSNDDLIVESLPNDKWENLMAYLEEVLKHKSYDGLIFDWNLRGFDGINPNGYTSVGLAQHLREIVSHPKEGDFAIDIPLILCSAKDKIEKLFSRDKTSHNLFDRVYDRNEMTEDADTTMQELSSIAEAYKRINQSNNFHEILGLTLEEYELLDIRLLDSLRKLAQTPTHEIARFVFRELINFEGIQIDEDVLAARLGVDKTSSEGNWEQLKNKIEPYTGVFSEGWNRWWWFKVEKWITDTFKIDDMQSRSATERVTLIKKACNLNSLVPAKPLKYCSSDEFWTTCYITKKPLDTIDGFLIDCKTNYAWQNEYYISNEVAIDEIESNKYSINVLEKARLANFKENLLNEQDS